jgi:hypothetical protein
VPARGRGGTIQGTFGTIEGTFGSIQGTFGTIEGTFGTILAVAITGEPRTPTACGRGGGAGAGREVAGGGD